MLSSLESIFISIMYCFSSVYLFGNIIKFIEKLSLKNSFLKFYCLREIITSGDEVDFVLNWGLFV